MANAFEIPDKIKFNIPDSKKLYDVIIIGAGPAGMTATVYCARKKLDILLISKDIGGQIIWTSSIENYMGYQYIQGSELSDKFILQLVQFPITMLQATAVCNLAEDGGNFRIKCGDNDYSSKAVIIATGKKTRQLGVPGEREFFGKGVAYCSVCDAPFFKNRTVAVIGGGNSALTAAIDILSYASKMYLINIADSMQGDPVLFERVENSGKVEIILSSKVKEIKGDIVVRGIVLENTRTGAVSEIEVGGVFVEIGLIPNSDFVKNLLLLNENGEIVIDSNSRTSVDGIFACGDVTDVLDKQIIIACGEGAKAALSVNRYVLAKR